MGRIEKELLRISRAEERLRKKAYKEDSKWKLTMEEKMPSKVLGGLKAGFKKSFEIIFYKGTSVIERTIKKDDIEKEFLIRDYAVELKESRKDLFLLDAGSEFSSLANLVASTAEGVGLGALGIGIPDILLFLAIILRGCYETALRYGFSYEDPDERLFILTLLEGAVQRNKAWDECNERIDNMMYARPIPDDIMMKQQLKRTTDSLATDMLLAKFIQGIPLVGIAGGLANPIFCNRIQKYVKLKYRKRYLLSKESMQILKNKENSLPRGIDKL